MLVHLSCSSLASLQNLYESSPPQITPSRASFRQRVARSLPTSSPRGWRLPMSGLTHLTAAYDIPNGYGASNQQGLRGRPGRSHKCLRASTLSPHSSCSGSSSRSRRRRSGFHSVVVATGPNAFLTCAAWKTMPLVCSQPKLDNTDARSQMFSIAVPPAHT